MNRLLFFFLNNNYSNSHLVICMMLSKCFCKTKKFIFIINGSLTYTFVKRVVWPCTNENQNCKHFLNRLVHSKKLNKFLYTDKKKTINIRCYMLLSMLIE